ncbi:UNVERIFIED_CONTAM: hypothetical protein NCL1_11005 [Trichonephila clavipes]
MLNEKLYILRSCSIAYWLRSRTRMVMSFSATGTMRNDMRQGSRNSIVLYATSEGDTMSRMKKMKFNTIENPPDYLQYY